MSLFLKPQPVARLDRPAVSTSREASQHPVVLLCEHASDYIPPGYHNLGLPPGIERTHIGWDIGAFALADQLSLRLGAPLISGNYSRLLIDLNRPLHAPDSMPRVSDGHVIPGNHDLEQEEKHRRQHVLFESFHDTVSQLLDRRQAAGLETRIVSVHSFTRCMEHGEELQSRPWEIGVLYEQARPYARQVMTALRRQGLVVGDNQPYQIHPDEDMAIPVHGDGRQIPSLLLEIRNDLLRDEAAISAWAQRLAPLL